MVWKLTRFRRAQGPFFSDLCIGVVMILAFEHTVFGQQSTGTGRYGYFSQENNSSVILYNRTWNVRSSAQLGFSFRTCFLGELLYQNGTSGDYLKLLLTNGSLQFSWSVGSNQSNITMGSSFNNNQWWTVNMQNFLGSLYLNLSQGPRTLYSQVISNSTFQAYILNMNLTGNGSLYVGRGYTGCLHEGPTVIFVGSDSTVNKVEWSNTSCPLSNASLCSSGTTVTDDCSGRPCLNGGTCTSVPSGSKNYSCTCPAGFVGPNCEGKINECGSNPCHNQADCLDENGYFLCNCTGTGYSGVACDVDIDECQVNSSICGSGGTCLNNPGSFVCQCPPGSNGPLCKNIDECLSNPCVNGATCEDRQNAYRCICQPGYTDVQCSTDIDDCSNVTCPGSGSQCIDGVNNYSCVCKPGYTGIHSNCTDIDECLPRPCKNSATCFNGENYYNCTCPAGYTDKNCSTNINECASNPCRNEGKCIDGVNNYTCICNSTVNVANRTFTIGSSGNNCEDDINECANVPSICQNNNTCFNKNGSYECLCGDAGSPGNYWTGKHCEVSTSYCTIDAEVQKDPPACKNGGTCTGMPLTYQCACLPGYTGQRCKTNINECDSNPCQYNSTCIDGINGYNCSCIPGITGILCETNIDECLSQPCAHGGHCIDLINGFKCNCTDTGFNGTTCMINIDDCEPHPCQHGATCLDGIKSYNCSCFNGYAGENCEVDVDECALLPCHYNSTCLQRSNSTLYDIDYPGFENLTFSFANAAGYLCQCVPGSAGENCSTNIDDCVTNKCKNGTCVDLLNDYSCNCSSGYEGKYCEIEINECDVYKACKFGSTCVDRVADYYCSCPLLHAGKNCTFNLTACEKNECHNGSTCQPYLINEILAVQDYRCLCADGYTGQYCNISTTMSFDTDSYINVTLNKTTVVSLSFRFRTTLPDGILFAWTGGRSSGLFLTVELKGGNLLMFNPNEVTQKSISNYVLNDGTWQKVSLTETNNSLSLSVTGSKCLPPQVECSASMSYSNESQPYQVAYFGNVLGTNQTVSGTQFIGCMEDVSINGTRLTLNSEYKYNLTLQNISHSFHNLKMGCLRIVQCDNNTCNGKGGCVDLWNKFLCKCSRPYLGKTCNTSYSAATFGYNGTTASFATFLLPQNVIEQLHNAFDLSLFIRSRKDTGFILVFGNQTNTFVTLELNSGQLVVNLQFCGLKKSNLTTTKNDYADGHQHFVRLWRNSSQFIFSVDSDWNLTTYDIPSNCSFQGTYLHFGGTPPATRRKKRQVTAIPYKGTIQDVQLNNMSLQFYNLSDPLLSTLPVITMTSSFSLEANEVTSPVCIQTSPCENNATCSDVFFDDFSCACPHGYRGKNCSQLDFCMTGACPIGAKCKSLMDGFECLSNATFDGSTSFAEYTNNLSATRKVEELTFIFRTLAMNGYILMIGNNSYYYKVRLVGRNLKIVYKLDNSNEMILTADYDCTDSRWYKAKVIESTSAVTLLLYDYGEKTVFANKSNLRSNNSESLDSLVKTSANKVKFGSFVLSSTRYQGCLGEVRLAGVLLPFFEDNTFVNNTAAERFMLQSYSFRNGCVQGIGCTGSTCRHNSQCVADYYTYMCNCSIGFTGQWCENTIDFCSADTSCIHGRCVNTLTGSLCKCYTGYSGTRCDADVNECNNDTVCLNNGNCTNSNGSFTCQCTDQYQGDRCNILKTQNCTAFCKFHGSCSDNACNCSLGYTGFQCDVSVDYCSSLPCQNNGTCQSHSDSQNFTCLCVAGYTGSSCENNVNDCLPFACANGGTCVDGLNSYNCNCSSTNYTGPNCTVIDDACIKYKPCQNNASCINTMADYKCDCANTGYMGIYCDTDVDECNASPSVCKNGAICTNTNGSYVCNCTLGYLGMDCDTPNCSAVSCINGGTCVTINSGTQWQCHCPEFYEGTYCEWKGPCAYQPCVVNNTANCTQDIHANTSWCHCELGFTGTTCSGDVDECNTSTPCFNGGTCHNSIGSFTCMCAAGYQGPDCQLREEAVMSSDNITWYIVGPILAVVLITIILGVVWFLICVRNKRATRGAYSPSRQEVTGSRVELGNVIKKPPLERLI